MLMRKPFWWISLMVLLGSLLLAIDGCAAPLDASKARSRAVIQQGGIVPAEELRVAEYLNYYEQHFPEPTDTALGLDVRAGNAQVPAAGGEAWVQIGLQARLAKAEEIAPLNLALVIDRSGSMDSPEKMPYLKRSLRVFLQSLAANDIVSIVAYSTESEVIVSAREVGDGAWIDRAIARLEPDGSTNLHGGLMLGFREVDRHFDPHRNNRVILLTDGIANVGVTDPERIAADAQHYNQHGIHLSTIGLGQDFNDALLSRLAIQGQGAYHYIDSAEEMDKVFRKDVLGLIQKAASDVSVAFRPGDGVRLVGLTGYEGQPPSGPVEVRLRDMGTGDSQVVLAQVDAAPSAAGRRLLAEVELRYTDQLSGRPAVVSAPVYAEAAALGSYDPLWDLEVLRNATIQRTAEGLKEIDRLFRSQRYREAWDLAGELGQALCHVAGLTGEEQMLKDAGLMRKYQDTLASWVESQTGRRPDAEDRAPRPTRFYRGAEPTAAPRTLDIQ
jgi:Ca-activated chloride channel family protein